MKLSELKSNEKGIILKVKGQGAFRKRITEMGFIRGKAVKVIKPAPLKDPIEYEIMGYDISLRKNEADLIEILSEEDAQDLVKQNFEGVITEELVARTVAQQPKKMNVAFVGNPNCGKTTLFNATTGARERVGNYSGVTVDSKYGKYRHRGYDFDLADLPGTYSLTAFSPEELFVRNYILNEVPDVVVNVVDASNLERNLYLTTQLIDMNIHVVLALNMYDELEKSGASFDYEQLSAMIGIPIVPTVGPKGQGVKALFDSIIDTYEQQKTPQRRININYGKDLEKSVNILRDEIQNGDACGLAHRISSRFMALKLLEGDSHIKQLLSACKGAQAIAQSAEKQISWLEQEHNEPAEVQITDARFGFISGALKETYHESQEKKTKLSNVIDTLITHKMWGFPIFLGFLWLMFQTTFQAGAYPMEWIEAGVGALSGFVEKFMPNGMLKDLLIGGIINGVGGVIVFLPNIIILFFFISLMEDTGYMARVAFIMDKLMHKIGLHGKSFIPLIMGFGCNVPAIMATRTLPNRNDRLLTMLINPFMSCSARLPVYILITAAFFPEHAGTVIFLIYTLGIVIAVLIALLFKKTLFRKNEAPFVMELPPYRMPTLRATVRHMWDKAVQYLKKMGGIILVASIIIWALGYFPRENADTERIDKKITALQSTTQPGKAAGASLDSLKTEKSLLRQKQSYIGHIGRAVAPAMAPLGFDWKMTVSLIAGVAAKEIVVSTLGVLYQTDGTPTGDAPLQERLRNETYRSGPQKGKPILTPIKALSFLIFILVYFPCVAVIAAIRNESGSWKWALFTMLYTTSLAWILSFITYQVGKIWL